MNDEQLITVLRANACVSDAQVALWSDAANLMAALDAIGRDGAIALVKIDGARLDGNIYTVLISGARLGDESFRKDGSDLPNLLRDAIKFYIAIVWPDAASTT